MSLQLKADQSLDRVSIWNSNYQWELCSLQENTTFANDIKIVMAVENISQMKKGFVEEELTD